MTKARALLDAGQRLLSRRLNRVKRAIGVGTYWEWMPENEIPETIDIMSMVFPLRYDVIIRKGFFDLYAELRSSGASRAVVMDAARHHEYYQWFHHIMVTRNAPHLLGDQRAIDALFEQRIDANIALYDSLAEHGFDERYPISPYGARVITFDSATRTSKARFFAGDGCHRIAALLSLGHDQIPKQFLKPKLFSRLTPLDNTTRVSEVVSVPPEWL